MSMSTQKNKKFHKNVLTYSKKCVIVSIQTQNVKNKCVQARKRGEMMRRYMIRIDVPEGEVKEILEELDKAQQTIYNCYSRLEAMGVINIIEKPSAATNGNSESD